MRVLHVNDYPPGPGGGAEVLLARTVALLRAEGVDVQVFSSADLPDARRTVRRYLDNPVARRALAERLDAFAPDVVHLHNFYHVLSPGILAGLARHRRRGGPRVVMTAHDYHLACPNSGGTDFDSATGSPRAVDPDRLGDLGYLLTRRWDRRGRRFSLLKLAQHLWNYRLLGRQQALDLVLCPSRFVERALRHAAPATCLLPHPAPTGRARSARRGGTLRLVFAGRLEPEKGFAEFLGALPGDFAGTLTVVGDGGELERCRGACRARGLADRVEFLGRLPHEQTLAHIAAAHVLVLPSRCLESYGLTLVEALAAGTNVLAADRGAMRELVEAAGVGYLFDPDDPASLAARLADVERDRRAGILNGFDVCTFLAGRDEAVYVRGLLAVYDGRPIPAPLRKCA